LGSWFRNAGNDASRPSSLEGQKTLDGNRNNGIHSAKRLLEAIKIDVERRFFLESGVAPGAVDFLVARRSFSAF